jgi:single-strand DNA-binding protein
MSFINTVIFTGNVVAEPSWKDVYVKSRDEEITHCHMVIAVKDGPKTAFVQVNAWERVAEGIERNDRIDKGAQVLVEGRLSQDNWERDGEKRSKVYVTAKRVQWLRSPRVHEDENVEENDEESCETEEMAS